MASVAGWTGADRVRAASRAADEQRGIRRTPGNRPADRQRLAREADPAPAVGDATTPGHRTRTRHRPTVKARFAALTDQHSRTTTDARPPTLRTDSAPMPNISAALQWLDQAANWEPGTARREVAARLRRSTYGSCATGATDAAAVNQRRVADALSQLLRRPRRGPRPVRRDLRPRRPGDDQHADSPRLAGPRLPADAGDRPAPGDQHIAGQGRTARRRVRWSSSPTAGRDAGARHPVGRHAAVPAPRR